MPPEDALKILGLEPGAKPEMLRRAYLRAVKRHPPERDPDGFRQVREAYELFQSMPWLLALEAASAPSDAPPDEPGDEPGEEPEKEPEKEQSEREAAPSGPAERSLRGPVETARDRPPVDADDEPGALAEWEEPAPPSEPDPELLELLDDPYQIEEAADAAIEHLRAARAHGRDHPPVGLVIKLILRLEAANERGLADQVCHALASLLAERNEMQLLGDHAAMWAIARQLTTSRTILPPGVRRDVAIATATEDARAIARARTRITGSTYEALEIHAPQLASLLRPEPTPPVDEREYTWGVRHWVLVLFALSIALPQLLSSTSKSVPEPPTPAVRLPASAIREPPIGDIAPELVDALNARRCTQAKQRFEQLLESVGRSSSAPGLWEQLESLARRCDIECNCGAGEALAFWRAGVPMIPAASSSDSRATPP